MGVLALPTFMGSPNDQPAVVDAYKESVSPEQRNSLSTKITSFTSGLDGAFDKAVGIAKNIGLKLAADTVNLPTAMARVKRALKGSRNDIMYLARQTEGLIMSELTGQDPNTKYVKTATDVARGLQLLTGDGKDIIKNFKSGDYDQMGAMVNFIGDLTNNPAIKLFDLGAEAAILRGVVEEVSAWGIPSLVDDLLKDQPDRTKYAVLKRSANSISERSNLDTLLAYVNVQNDKGVSLGANALNANTPDFAARVLNNYTFDAGTSPKDYPEIITKLVKALDALKPDWFWTTRGNDPVWNLGTLAMASEDTVTLLLTDDRYRDAILTAPFYAPASIEELVETMYPLENGRYS
jgi:hypothetical protein